MRHLLSIEDLDRARHRAHPRPREVVHRGLRARGQEGARAARPAGAEPLLRGVDPHPLLVRARRQDAQREVINFASGGSSVEKGESLKDTVQTLSAYRPDLIVIRTPHVGAAGARGRLDDAAVVNAGDGKHEHPTQALLDVYTLRERLGSLDGAKIWIVGDVMHSRVARSNVLAFTKLGAEVTVCGPPTLIPRGLEALGCEVELHARPAAGGRRRLRPAHAARADDGLLCPVPARVRRRLPDRRPPARRPPGAHAPRARQPRRRALRRGHRLARRR